MAEFTKDKGKKHGRRSYCLPCMRALSKARYAARKGSFAGPVPETCCATCRLTKPHTAFYACTQRRTGLSPSCRACTRKKRQVRMLVDRDIGVYKLTVGRLFYFGSTGESFRRRLNDHRRQLRTGLHANPRLKAEFDRCQTAELEPLAICDGDYARDLEAKLIDKHWQNPNCANLSPHTVGWTGNTTRTAPISVTWKDGREITYESRAKAAAAIGCNGRTLWRWLDNGDEPSPRFGLQSIKRATPRRDQAPAAEG